MAENPPFSSAVSPLSSFYTQQNILNQTVQGHQIPYSNQENPPYNPNHLPHIISSHQGVTLQSSGVLTRQQVFSTSQQVFIHGQHVFNFKIGVAPMHGHISEYVNPGFNSQSHVVGPHFIHAVNSNLTTQAFPSSDANPCSRRRRRRRRRRDDDDDDDFPFELQLVRPNEPDQVFGIVVPATSSFQNFKSMVESRLGLPPNSYHMTWRLRSWPELEREEDWEACLKTSRLNNYKQTKVRVVLGDVGGPNYQ